jgi:hypothetical protein
MTVKTMGSDQARLKMRDILDDVIGGAEVVIERYDKPTAVVIGYTQWQTWKRQRLAFLDAQSQEGEAGNFMTHEEVIADLRERGLID